MIVVFRFEVTDGERRAIRRHQGKSGMATRKEVVAILGNQWVDYLEGVEGSTPGGQEEEGEDEEEPAQVVPPDGGRCRRKHPDGFGCHLAAGHPGQHVDPETEPGHRVVWFEGGRAWRDWD
jgi:hypothetical protein